MGLTSSLSHAVGGLRAIETGLETVSRNVSNAGVEGYARRKVAPVDLNAGGVVSGHVQRELDLTLQKHMRAETGATAETGVSAAFLSRLDAGFGSPGGPGSLDTLFNSFNGVLEMLTAEPANVAARSAVTGAAQALTGGLNRLAGAVQALRADADAGMADAVGRANVALKTLEATEKDLSQTRSGNALADIMDTRDRALDTLAGLMDIRISPRGDGGITVATAGGAMLFAGKAARLEFDGGTPMLAGSSGGALKLMQPGGGETVLDRNWLRTGEIAGLMGLRDTILPNVQRSLDSVAGRLAEATNEGGVPLFVDAGNGSAITAYAGGAQETGFSARIAVDPALLRDPSPLAPSGSAAPARALVQALNDQTRSFQGPPSATDVFQGNVGGGIRHLLDTQGAMAADAQRLNEGQNVVLDGLRGRFAESSGVSVDQEMANLVELQNVYGANARIISVVQAMYDALLRI